MRKKTKAQPGTQRKESQIASGVFGRQPDFDPQLDSFVRVQAGRLRAKLAEYYSSEGVSDPVVVELPKGSYALAVHERTTAASGNGATLDSHASSAVHPSPASPSSRSAVTLLSVAL